MNIQTAALLAAKEGEAIYRRGNHGVVIIPTNTSGCCYVDMRPRESSTRPGRCWMPTLADLIANDWEVVR